MQEVDDITLISKVIYLINFAQPIKRFISSLHYNESNRFLFFNTTKI